MFLSIFLLSLFVSLFLLFFFLYYTEFQESEESVGLAGCHKTSKQAALLIGQDQNTGCRLVQPAQRQSPVSEREEEDAIVSVRSV